MRPFEYTANQPNPHPPTTIENTRRDQTLEAFLALSARYLQLPVDVLKRIDISEFQTSDNPYTH